MNQNMHMYEPCMRVIIICTYMSVYMHMYVAVSYLHYTLNMLNYMCYLMTWHTQQAADDTQKAECSAMSLA